MLVFCDNRCFFILVQRWLAATQGKTASGCLIVPLIRKVGVLENRLDQTGSIFGIFFVFATTGFCPVLDKNMQALHRPGKGHVKDIQRLHDIGKVFF